MTKPLVRATSFLHCNLNCVDLARSTRFYEDLFGLRVVMRADGKGMDGSGLGIPGPTDSMTHFLYDHRGARVSPALELVAWSSPAPVGAVYPSPAHIGFQSVAFAVPALPDAEAIASRGGALVGRGDGAVTARDPSGVLVEIVEEGGRAKAEARHIRASCCDLERSRRWYESIGFRALGEAREERWPTWRFGADAVVRSVTLTLDDAYALELTQWLEPAARGYPYDVANHRGLYRIALAVEDVRAAHRALSDEGSYALEPPVYFPLPGTPIPGLWISFLRDPDGLVVELVERPRAAVARTRQP